MEHILIKEITATEINKRISPDFIYNRFDLFEPYVPSAVLQASVGNKDYYVGIQYSGKTAVMGLWLNAVPERILRRMVDYVFRRYRAIEIIRYFYGLVGLGRAYSHNHFRIELPNTEEELEMRLSAKGRYNIKRERRLLERDYERVIFGKYSAENCPIEEIFNQYFLLKQATHGAEYNLSGEEYIRKFHVTDIFTLSLNEQIVAIILSCEQCDIAYMENITYDTKYSKYSLGQVLYDEYLRELIRRGKKEIYLGGGDLKYKSRYGGIEEKVYSGEIYRNWRIDELSGKVKAKLNLLVKTVRSIM